MPFAWNSLGPGPDADEAEVSVFGPGFGECIVVHLGSGNWIVIDSCIDASDSENRQPVAERYLRAIGVEPSKGVRLIVATHWHDDHVRGMARLVEVCANAQFACSAALLKEEFVSFVKQISTGSLATDGGKVREISRVLDVMGESARTCRMAIGGRVLYRCASTELAHGKVAQVISLSPSDREYDLFLRQIASMVPIDGMSKMAAPLRQSANLSAIVLSVSIGDEVVALCSDMELHPDADRGWNSVLKQAELLEVGSAAVIKVAHHGSQNGHHSGFWDRFVARPAVSLITPFNHLPEKSKLPTDADIDRLAQLSSTIYLTGPKSFRKSVGGREHAVERSLREACIELRSLRSPLGMVRLRRKISGAASSVSGWRAAVYPPATQVLAATNR